MNTFAQNVRLSASDGLGRTGTSSPFNLGHGAPTHYAWSPISSPATAGQPFSATITALDAGENPISGYIGYAQLSPILPERAIGSGTSTSSTFPCSSAYA